MEKEIIVTFHRTYKVPVKLIIDRIEEDTSVEDIDDGDLFGYAEEIARDWLNDEMPEFLNNTHDFVSATCEII